MIPQTNMLVVKCRKSHLAKPRKEVRQKVFHPDCFLYYGGDFL